MKHRRRLEPVPDPPSADVFDLQDLKREWGQVDSIEAAKGRHPTGKTKDK